VALSKAAKRGSIAPETTKSGSAVTACREDDARSTSASSMQGDGGSDAHAMSSDEEHETAMKESEAVQHRNVLANAPWRQEEQERQQRQKQKQKQSNIVCCKVEQPCAPPGLPPPATAVGGNAAFASLWAPVFRLPPGLSPPGLPPPPGFMELPPGLLFPEVKPVTAAVQDSNKGNPAAFEYTAHAFRQELAKILRELRLHKNPGLAVGQVRICGVPPQHQAAEFADILTRAAKESRGPARNIVTTELVPTLKAVLQDGEMAALQPSLFDAVGCYAA